MVRVMVRQENVPESRQWHAGEYELARNTVATIDHVSRVVEEYDLCWRGARLSWPRSTSRAEEDQLHLVALPGRRPRPEGRTGHGCCPNEKSASIDSHPARQSAPSCPSLARWPTRDRATDHRLGSRPGSRTLARLLS